MKREEGGRGLMDGAICFVSLRTGLVRKPAEPLFAAQGLSSHPPGLGLGIMTFSSPVLAAE